MLCICAAPEHRDALCKRYRSFRGELRCCADPHVASSAVYRPTTTPIRTQSKAGDAFSTESRHSRRRRLDQLQSGTGLDFDSRARPLHIPPDEREGHHHEPDHQPGEQLQQYSGSSGQAYHDHFFSRQQHQSTDTTQFQQFNFSDHQRQPVAEKRNELIISTKQFKDGYSYAQPAKSSRSSYLEQFWVCGSRYVSIEDVQIY